VSQAALAQSSSAQDIVDATAHIQLYSSGRFSETIPLAQRAITIEEKVFGLEDHGVAVSLNNLAALPEAHVEGVEGPHV
jgi:hypothetical protein